MIEISVCDDDADDLRRTVQIIDEIMAEQSTAYRLHAFQSAAELLRSPVQTDIAILDIAMDECNGIELGRRIRGKFPEIKLIYTTFFESYCMQALNEAHAFSYLCKPIIPDRMQEQLTAVLAAIPDIGPDKTFYDLTDSHGKYCPAIRLRLNDIFFLEYIKRQRKAAIMLKEETYVCKCVFEKLAEELAPFDFVVNSRGMLVNLRHVENIQGGVVCLDNSQKLPIAQKRMTAFRESLHSFLQKKI